MMFEPELEIAMNIGLGDAIQIGDSYHRVWYKRLTCSQVFFKVETDEIAYKLTDEISAITGVDFGSDIN